MSANVTRWWWIRHAPVTCHGGKIYGQDDLPADCSDPDMFAYLAPLLPGNAVWVTSPLQRTQQTAAALRAAMQAAAVAVAEADHDPSARAWAEAVIEASISEQHFGEWQGLSHDELYARRDGAWHRFWWAPAHETPPGGESFEQVVARVSEAVDRLTGLYKGRDIIAIAHGGSIRAALVQALGLHPERALSIVVDNCSLTRIDYVEGPGGPGSSALDPSWRVTAVNLHPKAPIRR
jgi:broad specificity phosphatase PhoE